MQTLPKHWALVISCSRGSSHRMTSVGVSRVFIQRSNRYNILRASDTPFPLGGLLVTLGILATADPTGTAFSKCIHHSCYFQLQQLNLGLYKLTSKRISKTKSTVRQVGTKKELEIQTEAPEMLSLLPWVPK